MAMNSNNSKYKNIISKSVLKMPGLPAVYQLRAEKRTGNVQRVTVGERIPNKPNKTILLVGETGAGKSALINTLFNYAMGVMWEDEIWFQIVEEDKKRRLTDSQTSDVIVYEILGFEGETLPYSLTIIDTPGFGDTKGIEHDVFVNQKLLDVFRSEDGVHEVHAVGLVMKATDNRLSDRLRYIHDSVMSLFGKDLETKIIALITHSDGRRPKHTLQMLEDMKIKCAKNEKNEPVHFVFNNCHHENRTEEEEFLQHADLISTKGLRGFTAFLEKAFPQKLVKTVEVLNERVRLTACIQNLQERIKLTELKQTEITQIQEALKKYKGSKNELPVEIDRAYKVKEYIKGGRWFFFFYEGAVCCTDCEETCHYPGCTIAWKPEHCEVMKGGCCTSCNKQCPASKHVKVQWRYVMKTRKFKMNEADLKKYERSINLKEEIEKLAAEKSKFLDEAYQHVAKLEHIALKPDSLSTYVHLEFLIDKMKEKGDTLKVQKLEEMRSRVNEGTRAAMQHLRTKLTEAS